MIQSEALGYGAAHGVPSYDGGPELELVHERGQIVREIAWIVAHRRAIRLAMAPLGQSERVHGSR
jgi:hypothetical protein